LKLVPLGVGEIAVLVVEPSRGFDCGAGPGKRVEQEIKGGTVGVVLDARGRPLAMPEEVAARREAVKRWINALELYSETSNSTTETRSHGERH
jgi:hypothetical protein